MTQIIHAGSKYIRANYTLRVSRALAHCLSLSLSLVPLFLVTLFSTVRLSI
ncbi:hypothetical protein GBAR_LOCUS16525 [Geodia barretti]|uniref:Uncharacterized protein n=1 Tax=Geodia barretti TaxID=519541 RepID=A0AA35SFA8_GEOBA|nr:hypothetical protein GBAR_LOCUS16525 [Geodia barretti]